MIDEERRFTVAEGDRILSQIKDTSTAFIFNHPICAFSYAAELEDHVYHMDDPDLDDEAVMGNAVRHLTLFGENITRAYSTGKSIIDLPYNRMLAFWASGLLPKFETKANVQALSFFHSDDISNYLPQEYRDEYMEVKFLLLESMIDFPFIKKLEIPLKMIITEDYLIKQMVMSKAELL